LGAPAGAFTRDGHGKYGDHVPDGGRDRVRPAGKLVDMSDDLELADRVERVLAATAGDIVNPAVAGLMTAAALATGNPALAVWAIPAGAAAGALTNEGALLVRRAWSDRSSRAERFARAAAEEAGVSIDEIASIAAASEDNRRLLGVTLEAATEAHSEWKLRTLARAFVRGASDGAKVDEMVYLTARLRDLEVADVRILKVLSCKTSDGSAWWALPAISDVDRGLDRVAVVLLDRLVTTGLARSNGNVWMLSDVGSFIATMLEEIGSRPGPDDH